ncbi:MAG: hypothetical protein JWO57_1620, partial [Pseudonocardiales bacterium]|nr:hypothetical protein [Pseudonocardiales bacterium]
MPELPETTSQPISDDRLTVEARDSSNDRSGLPTGRLRRASTRVKRSPWLMAGLFVAPYLILMITWAISNPPGAAPDEPSHLVKSLGMAHFDVGSKYIGTSGATCPASEGQCGHSIFVRRRGDSLRRVVQIPARLSPAGLTCEAFRPDVSAACLSNAPPPGHGTLTATTALGSYPPVLYVPIGLAAISMPTPVDAFLAARVVCALMSA